MDTHLENQASSVAYRRIKETIDASYPGGWFAAVSGDRVIAAAADFRQLEEALRAQGLDPRGVLVVEAAVDYREHVTIFI